MQLSKNFTLEELVKSTTATRLGINNTPPADAVNALRWTATVLEKIRAHLSLKAGRDIPIIITSGYRCQALNAAVGSKPSSDHTSGQAVDFRAPEFGTPTAVCRALAPYLSPLSIGQLINEFPDADGWVHVGTPVPANVNNRVITISHAFGTLLGVADARGRVA